jgi:hypothetical protein
VTDTTRPAPRTGDFLGTVALLLVLYALSAVFVVLGLGIGFAAFGCADADAVCNETTIQGASIAILFGIPAIALVATIVSIVRLVRRRIAFWVPLVATALVVGVYLVGTWLVGASIA